MFPDTGEAERHGSAAVIGIGDAVIGAGDDDEIARRAAPRVERKPVIHRGERSPPSDYCHAK